VQKLQPSPSLSPLQLILSVSTIALLVVLIVMSARFGYSRILSRYALATNSIIAANEAVRLTPSDPDARRVRAATLNRARLFQEAERELVVATKLRRSDDYLWLELGSVRDELGDSQGAFIAFDQAVKWAPFYAHTLWERGNILLRAGRYDEAFGDLCRAADANRTFLPNLLDLAWSLSREDANATSQWAKIDSDYERVFFTRFLANKGRGAETLAMFRAAAGAFTPEQKKDLIRQLIARGVYREAFEIWKTDVGLNSDRFPLIYDGGFESALAIEAVGFGWYVSRSQSTANLSIDVNQHHSGGKSLRAGFSGGSDPGLPIISQTILVKPQTHYRVSFAVRTADVVTGGLPYIELKDATTGFAFAKSDPFPEGTVDWRGFSFEWQAPASSEGVVLTLRRTSCGSGPCPIFGTIWLDSFSIEEIPAR
jgi:hypothetical protein